MCVEKIKIIIHDYYNKLCQCRIILYKMEKITYKTVNCIIIKTMASENRPEIISIQM